MAAKTKVDIEPDAFNCDTSFNIGVSEYTNLGSASASTVSKAVGKIRKGMNVFFFNSGQFSLSEVIDYVLRGTGKADLYISTWTASQEGLNKAFEFLQNRRINSIKFMVDRGFKQFKGKPYEYLIKRFGNDCIRTTRIHAKFVVIQNDDFNIVIRTSANLNRNARLENFELTDNKEFTEFFKKFFVNAWEIIQEEDNFQIQSSRKLDAVVDSLVERKKRQFSPIGKI